MGRARIATAALFIAAACAPTDLPEGEALVVTKESGGEEIRVPAIEHLIDRTRVWYLGDPGNVTRIYLLVHGDGATDYSSSTASDRAEMEALLPEGEGAIVAYPVSPSDDWPGFGGGDNGWAIVTLFEELRGLSGASAPTFEQFALSGGGRVNHALMRLVNESYDSDPAVRRFVDESLRGVHDGDSLCYSIDSMREAYIALLERFPAVSACFIHNTSGTMSYVHGHHNRIAQHFNSGEGYPFGGSLSLEDGRLRFWAAPTHWTAWSGQFAEVFFGAAPPDDDPTPRSWIGGPCASDEGCIGGRCLTEADGYPDGMCTESCDRLCPDRAGQPVTFCIDLAGLGACHSQADSEIFPATGCREGYEAVETPRFGEPESTALVCLPSPDDPPPDDPPPDDPPPDDPPPDDPPPDDPPPDDPPPDDGPEDRPPLDPLLPGHGMSGGASCRAAPSGHGRPCLVALALGGIVAARMGRDEGGLRPTCTCPSAGGAASRGRGPR